MRWLWVFVLLVSVLTITRAAPTTETQCIPHGEECDPEITGSRWTHEGSVHCCWTFQACMGQLLDDGTVKHTCVTILPG